MSFRQLTCLSLIFCLLSCQYVETPELDQSMSSIRIDLKRRHELPEKQWENNRDAIEVMKHQLNQIPRLEGELNSNPRVAEAFLQKNQKRIQAWLEKIELAQKMVVKQIKELGRETYELALAPREVAIRQGMIALDLFYLREFNQKTIHALLPLALVAQAPELDKVEAVNSFRKQVLDQHLICLGLGEVIDQDLNRTLDVLKNLRQDGMLPAVMEQALKRIVAKVYRENQKQKQQMQAALASLSTEQRAQLAELQTQYKQAVKGVSLLFDPLQPDAFIVDVLVVIGNLTWGLVNTLVGGIVILGAAIASPFSKYVNFPTFRWAQNGQQIAVDVSGIWPSHMASKVSLGLFELRNGAGWSSLSNHEGGHAKQSALLGPLYIPLVLGSYAVQGHHSSFMETWADEWATTLD